MRGVVKDRLKAPGTADFSEQTNESTGYQSWAVTGVVDAENSFGAKLRAPYSCDMKYLGNDEWRAESVSLNE